MSTPHHHHHFESNYGYVPNLPVNIVAAVIFGVYAIIQVCLGIWTRDWWMFVTWGITTGLECAGYIARAISHKYPDSMPMFEMQLVCLIIAPAFMAAGLYYQLAKAVTVYGEHYSLMKPMIYSAIFTTCDVVCLIVQAAGGGTADADLNTPKGPATGGWVMLAGIALQVAILSTFILIYLFVYYRILTEKDKARNWNPRFEPNRRRPLFKYWFPAVCISLLFLLIRSIYRIAELAGGWTGRIIRTERYFMVCDGLMIALGIFPLCVVYPAVAYGYVPVRGLHYDAKEPAAWTPGEEYDDCAEKSDLPSNDPAYLSDP